MLLQNQLAYSLRDAAKMLGLSVPTLRKLIKSKRLTARAAGAKFLITAEDLKRYLDSLPIVEPKSDAA